MHAKEWHRLRYSTPSPILFSFPLLPRSFSFQLKVHEMTNPNIFGNRIENARLLLFGWENLCAKRVQITRNPPCHSTRFSFYIMRHAFSHIRCLIFSFIVYIIIIHCNCNASQNIFRNSRFFVCFTMRKYNLISLRLHYVQPFLCRYINLFTFAFFYFENERWWMIGWHAVKADKWKCCYRMETQMVYVNMIN